MVVEETATSPLERIIEAEAKAKKVIAEAEEAAKKTVLNAQIQAKKNIDAAEAEYSVERETKNEQALKTAEKNAKDIERKCNEEIDSLRRATDKNANAARDFIIKGVLSDAGWK